MQQREVVLRFGQTGSGKTYSANQKLRTLTRVLVGDCGFGEFDAQSFDTFPDCCLYLESIGAFENKSVPFRVAYTPKLGEHSVMFTLAKELGYCHLFLEEGDMFGDPRQDPDYWDAIVRGRHWCLSLEFLGVNPYLCPIDVRRQSTEIISFRQTEPADISWLAQRVGDIAYELPNLPGPGLDSSMRPPYPYLHWRAGRGGEIVRP